MDFDRQLAVAPSGVDTVNGFGTVFGDHDLSEAARMVVLYLQQNGGNWEVNFTPADITQKVLAPAGFPAEFDTTALIAGKYLQTTDGGLAVTDKFVMVCQAMEMIMAYSPLECKTGIEPKVLTPTDLGALRWPQFSPACGPYFEVMCACGKTHYLHPFLPSTDVCTCGTTCCMAVPVA